MSEKLEFTLLGSPSIYLDGHSLPKYVSKKARALLLFLTVTDVAQTRDEAAGLLWSEMQDVQARKNLRTALSELRRAVGDHLVITNRTLLLDKTSNIGSDIDLFTSTLESKPAEVSLGELYRALTLYQGEFLKGFHIRNAAAFEEWVRFKREHLRGLALQGLDALVDRCAVEDEFAMGLSASRRLLELEPWLESAHRQQMILLARSGQRKAALFQYEVCKKAVATEHGGSPSLETTRLYEHIRSGQYDPNRFVKRTELSGSVATEPLLSSRELASSNSSFGHRALDYELPHADRLRAGVLHPGRPTSLPHNLITVSQSFVGREVEMGRLRWWLNNPNQRLLTISGATGSGKTRLALNFAHRIAIQEHLQPQDKIHKRPAVVDGVYMVWLPADNPFSSDVPFANFLVQSIADALGLTLDGFGGAWSQLIDYIRLQKLLIILDDILSTAANHGFIGDPASVIADLLKDAPNLKLLVVAEQALQVIDEDVLEIKGLSLALTRRSDWQAQDAIQLFLQACNPNKQASRSKTHHRDHFHRNYPDRIIDAIDVDSILRLCHWVGGSPLAIQLLASLVREHDVEYVAHTFIARMQPPDSAEIVGCIEEKPASMAARIKAENEVRKHNRPPYKEAVNTILDLIWHTELTREEQESLLKLSVFNSPFTEKMAHDICLVHKVSMSNLMDYSLLEVFDQGQYRIHDAVRLFVEERDRTDMTSEQCVRCRFCNYYANWMWAYGSAEESEMQSEMQAVKNPIFAERKNVMQAWIWAIELQNSNAMERLQLGLEAYEKAFGPMYEGFMPLKDMADEVAFERTKNSSLGKLKQMLDNL